VPVDKNAVIDFFNHCAPSWDADMIRNEHAIRTILDNGGVRAGIDVLDVACGTGVLFPDYFARGVASLTGVDISPEMAKRAREKFPRAEVICADVEDYPFDRRFDAVMVYNAFPHFPDPGRLIEVLAGLTKPGGRLSVAHGMSREKIGAHHAGAASKVSIGLLDEHELAALFAPWFDVDVKISDDEMYQVAGTRR
jgi:demethylmenaquinone methyltransferase/2-methoxy-6-polyprenyl-1,4-benzoquinol methylase